MPMCLFLWKKLVHVTSVISLREKSVFWERQPLITEYYFFLKFSYVSLSLACFHDIFKISSSKWSSNHINTNYCGKKISVLKFDFSGNRTHGSTPCDSLALTIYIHRFCLFFFFFFINVSLGVKIQTGR